MRYDSIKLFFEKNRKGIQNTKRILKKSEMNHDEINADNFEDKKDIWVDYVKNDILCTAFSYARYSKAMKDITGFSMKNCLSLPGLG